MREKLINICTPRQWKTLSTSELKNEGYTVYGANGVIGYYSEYNHEVETVMVTCRGATCGTVNISKPYSYINGNAMCMDDLRRDIDVKYLYYALKNYDFKEVISGSAQPQITRQGLNNVFVEVVDKPRQLEIVKVLSNVEETITRKQQQLAEYDQLIKSRFVEMFGQDLKGKSIRLGDLAEVITKGTTPTTLGYDFVDDGVNFIKVECITETGKFIKEKMLHINEECNEKLKRSKLKKDDILFSIAGAIGRTAIVTDDILPANTNQALSIIRLRKDVGLNVEFLNQVFKTDLIADQIEKRINGVAQMNVSLADIGNLKIIRPTIERQNEFAKFVEQVDKLKFEVQKSLNETQTLFDSLMQEYFG